MDARRRLRWAFVVLGAAGYLLVQAIWRPDPPPMAGCVIDIAADRGGFNHLARWNLHHKEWVRLAPGNGVVVMGLAILATV